MTNLHYAPAPMALVALLTAINPVGQAADDAIRAPEIKFFYYDSERIEWVVSAEPDRLQAHLQANPDSARLFGSLAESIDEPGDMDQVRTQMTSWLEGERERFGELGGSSVRLRKAEGIVAYLRAHDFSIDALVKQLLKRSGATEVELVGVHLVRGARDASFQLKVVLPDETIGIGRQGYNVAIQSPDVTYTSVVYALGLALYEVHEVINSEPGTETPSEPGIEALPPPEIGATASSGVP